LRINQKQRDIYNKHFIMKEKLKRIIVQLFATHLGRILVGAILIVIGGSMSPLGIIGENIYNVDEGIFWWVLFYIGMVLIVGESLLLITFGLIINPIRGIIRKIKNK